MDKPSTSAEGLPHVPASIEEKRKAARVMVVRAETDRDVMSRLKDSVGPAWLKAAKGDVAEAVRLKCARLEKDAGDAEAECRELHRKLDGVRKTWTLKYGYRDEDHVDTGFVGTREEAEAAAWDRAMDMAADDCRASIEVEQ